MLRNAHGHGNVFPAGFFKEAAQQAGAEMRVAPSAGDSQNLKFRTSQREPNGEGIINIVADVGVDDNFFKSIRWRRRGLRLRERRRTQEETNGEHSAT
jgi:hypothetical protein